MASAQPGIFALGTASHAYLELDLAAGADARQAVMQVASLREPRTTIGGVNLVVGFRPELWASIAPDAAPTGVAGFNQPMVGAGGYVLPATQHDIVVWLTGSGYDVVFDLSRTVIVGLAGAAELANEIVGWPYHHDRDLTGFIDGTENPTLVEASSVAIIPEGSPGEGGSILLLQQWEHDAVGWERLSVDAQETIIGRRKADSAELDPAATRVARRADRPGSAGQDLPPQHRVRDPRAARDDLRGLQPGAADPAGDAGGHDRARRRAGRPADHGHPGGDRGVLRDPVGGSRGRAGRRRGLTRGQTAP